jgi:hypothetical protein
MIGAPLLWSCVWDCCIQTKCCHVRKKKPIPLSGLPAQQDEEDRAHSAREGERGVDVEKPLPAYHEAVNDQEQMAMLADYAIRRHYVDAAVAPSSAGQPGTAGSSL